MSTKSILTKSLLHFRAIFKQRLLQALKLTETMDGVLKPYVDTFITDTYGTAVGIINPDAPIR
jgi:hypothetical protein